MLRARLVTAAVAIPSLLLLIFAAPDWAFALFIASIATVGLLEFTGMAFAQQPAQRRIAIACGFLVIVASTFGPTRQYAMGGLAAAYILSFIWALLGREDSERALVDFGIVSIGLLYTGFLVAHFVWMRGIMNGPEWITFTVFVGMMGDTSGYFVGRAFGRHKLIPRVSPGKTVEGALGIMAGSLLAGLVCWWWPFQYIYCGEPFLGLYESLGLAFVMGTLGQLGDLCESVLKRNWGAKESGWIFPGHGGVLDRVDSLLFPLAFLFYYATLLR